QSASTATSSLSLHDALPIFDALAGHGVAELDVDLARGQLQPADPVEQRHDDRAAADDHLDALVTGMGNRLAALVVHLGAAGPGDDDRLVRAGHLVAAGDERQ